MQDHPISNTSSVSIKSLLTDLGFDQQAIRQLMREARQEAKAAKEHITHPVIWGLLVTLAVPIAIGVGYGGLQFLPPPLRTLGMIMLAAGAIFLMVKGRARELDNVLKPHVKRVLAKRGYRFCPNCEYNVTGLPAQRRTCPECGSRLELPEEISKDRQRKWFKAWLKRDYRRRPFVKGVDLTDAHFEALTDHIRNPPPVRRHIVFFHISGCLTQLAVAIFAAGAAFNALSTKVWRLPAVAISFLIGWGLIVLFLMIHSKLGQRVAIRDHRKLLRKFGLNLCIYCGQYWGDVKPQPRCSACNRRNSQPLTEAPIESRG